MTPEETERSARFREMIEAYEKETNSAESERMLNAIVQATSAEKFEITNYYEACSLEQFCDSLATEKIQGINFSKEEAYPIIKEMIECDDIERKEYLLLKYGSAIDFVFRKNLYISDAVYREEMTYDGIVDELNKSDGGPILL